MKKNTIKTKKKISTEGGFSLVELLVSLLVLSFGILGVASLMVGNIKTSITAKNQVIASQLAQEGIELVRNLRDNNEPTLAGLAIGDYADMRIDKTMSTIDNVSDKRLYLNSGFYTHSSAAPATSTKFYRKMDISIDADNLTVTSHVNWHKDGTFGIPCNIGNSCISVTSVLPKP